MDQDRPLSKILGGGVGMISAVLILPFSVTVFLLCGPVSQALCTSHGALGCYLSQI